MNSKPPYLVIPDEFGSYVFQIEELTKLFQSTPGIPKHKYLVRDGRVFVAAKLEADIRAKMRDGVALDQALALSLLPDAWVTPSQAVTEWKIVPEPFKIDFDGRFRILHEEMDAVLPTSYATEAEALPDLAKLIVGDAIPGQGELTVGGQYMTFRRGFSLAVAPPCTASLPRVDSAVSVIPESFNGIGSLSRAVATALEKDSSYWTRAERAMQSYLYDESVLLWRQAAVFGLDALYSPRRAAQDEDEQALHLQMRECFPELSMFSDAALAEQYADFKRCEGDSRWSEPFRENNFLFFLVGRLSNNAKPAAYDDIFTGLLASYAVVQGVSPIEATANASVMAAHVAMTQTDFRRASRAMAFLAEHPTGWVLHGAEMVTLTDIFQRGRSFNARASTVSQSQDDFVQPSAGATLPDGS